MRMSFKQPGGACRVPMLYEGCFIKLEFRAARQVDRQFAESSLTDSFVMMPLVIFWLTSQQR